MESEATQQSPAGSSIAFMAWVEVNKKRLLIGGAVILVAILAVALFVQQQTAKERAASRAFSDVKLPLNPGTPAPGSAEALLKVASDYSGTKAAVRALLTAGGLLFSERKYAEAEALFTRVTREYPDTPWLPEALLGIASALDAQGKTTEAIAKYEDIRRRYDKSPVIEDAKISLARLYEAQKPEDAYKIYDDLAKTMSGSRLAMEASMRQADLLKARPELAKLKEALMPPTVPSVSMPPAQTIQVSNLNRATTSNLPTIRLTNTVTGTSPAIQIKLPSNPAASPSPAPAPAPAPAK
jgi:tetratricopeptide (TPR) repeat protein